MDGDGHVSSKGVLSLGFKLIGLYYLIRWSSIIPFYFWRLNDAKEGEFYATLTSTGVQLCLILLLLFASDWLASLLVRDDSFLDLNADIVPGVLMSAFLMVGLMLMFQGLPNVIVTGSRAVFNGTAKLLDYRWFESFLKVLFGFGIVLSARKGTRIMLGESSLISGFPDDFPSQKHIPFIVLAGAVVVFLTLYIFL